MKKELKNKSLNLEELTDNDWYWSETENRYIKVRYLQNRDNYGYTWCNDFGFSIEKDIIYKHKPKEN